MVKLLRERQYLIWFIIAFLLSYIFSIYAIIQLFCGTPPNKTLILAVISVFWILIFIALFSLWKKLKSKKETREKARYVLSIGIFLLISFTVTMISLISQGF